MTVDNNAPTDDWRIPIQQAVKNLVDGEQVQDKTLMKKAARYVLIGNDLYKRGFSTPLLKCLDHEQASYVLNELHNGVCGMHCGQKTLAARVLRAGYYWPSVREDCAKYVKRCKGCQENDPLIHRPSVELQCIQSLWLFAKWGMDIVGPFPPASGQRKFLIVAIDYFSKWIEAEPLAKITAANVQHFMWKVVCRFGIPHTIITDNDRQFIDRKLETFLRELGIKHVTTSVEHLQTNGQAKAANKVILGQLKRRLGAAKGKWADELLEVLWAYRCTPQSSTGETSYNLTYGTDAMLPVEVGETTLHRQLNDLKLDEECMKIELDLLEELREKARLREEVGKQHAARRYKSKVKLRTFQPRDLVWRMTGDARKNPAEGKFAPNWEGPYQILRSLENGAYQLEHLNGDPIPRTWNANHLKIYYS